MKHESRINPWPWLHYFIVQVLLKGPSPLSLYQSLPSLTGNISVATVHVRLPIPTLNAAVNSIKIGSGSHSGTTGVGSSNNSADSVVVVAGVVCKQCLS